MFSFRSDRKLVTPCTLWFFFHWKNKHLPMRSKSESVNINWKKKAQAIYFHSWQPFWVWRAAVISLASPSPHSRALCPLLSAISSCHVTSYLLGLQGHCLSDWQGFDSTQYSNNLRAWRHTRITAWQNPPVGRARESEWRGKRANEKGEDQDESKPFMACQNHGQ